MKPLKTTNVVLPVLLLEVYPGESYLDISPDFPDSPRAIKGLVDAETDLGCGLPGPLYWEQCD